MILKKQGKRSLAVTYSELDDIALRQIQISRHSDFVVALVGEHEHVGARLAERSEHALGDALPEGGGGGRVGLQLRKSRRCSIILAID